jgi:hypothetical protein
MEYVDPYHKRTEFTADAYSSACDENGRRVVFSGRDHRVSVVLHERDTTIIASIPDTEHDIVLLKAHILGKLKWLILDFENNPVLLRIVVLIEGLDADELEADLKSLIGTRSVLYFRSQ